jgi:hypothetical protein
MQGLSLQVDIEGRRFGKGLRRRSHTAVGEAMTEDSLCNLMGVVHYKHTAGDHHMLAVVVVTLMLRVATHNLGEL